MAAVIFDITTSLDGFIAGPNPSVEHPLGEGGERLHEWAFALAAFRKRHGESGGETGPDNDVLEGSIGRAGAFVTDGIETAVEQARAAAGDRDVSLAGGANVIQQALQAGLVDEMELHVVPVMLGSGTRLFDGLADAGIEVEKIRAIDSPNVTHLTFRIVK
jgi:hypothetical protein